MTEVIVEKLGGSLIIRLPDDFVQNLEVKVGDNLYAQVSDRALTLSPNASLNELQELINGSEKSAFEFSEEDKEWLDTTPKGREV